VTTRAEVAAGDPVVAAETLDRAPKRNRAEHGDALPWTRGAFVLDGDRR